MTKAQIQTSVRNLCNEMSADAGAFLREEENLNDFIEDAAEIVVLDLADLMPQRFLTSENMNLVAGTAGYNLTSEWLQIWTLNRNENGHNPTPIDFVDTPDIMDHMYVGETHADPSGWYLKGTQINFVPTPSENKTAGVKAWIITAESAKIADTGPTMIPRVAHRLVVYMACILIGTALEANTGNFQALYKYRLDRVKRIIGPQVQSQPRFVKPSVAKRSLSHERERAFYDDDYFFGR